MLGGLYEETGQVDKALATYSACSAATRRTSRRGSRSCSCSQVQGELDQAIGEYEALIRAAPHNPDFVFQLAEALIQRGDRAKAPRSAEEARGALGRRTRRRWRRSSTFTNASRRRTGRSRCCSGWRRRGPRIRSIWSSSATRYWQEGDKKKALQTWQRIRDAGAPTRRRRCYTLGEVYLEHDMPSEALEALREADEARSDQVRTTGRPTRSRSSGPAPAPTDVEQPPPAIRGGTAGSGSSSCALGRQSAPRARGAAAHRDACGA